MALTSFLSAPVPAHLKFKRPFIKMHGLRNHFVFVEQRHDALPLSAEEIIRLCDVHEGVGAEQVIAIEEATEAGRADGAYSFMRIYNTDGRESQACGNATRCMARLLFEETGKKTLVIETVGGLLHCEKISETDVSVTLGPIRMAWQSIPLAQETDTMHLPLTSGLLRDGVALNIGNPHAVFFVDDFDAISIPTAARVIAGDPLFPESVNVGIAQVIDKHTLKLAVWERPGMLTDACGTGACVAAYAGRLRGHLTSDEITVNLPAGALHIRLLNDGRAVMTGPIAFCCCGYA
jgi:diaminopimelate epimerase